MSSKGDWNSCFINGGAVKKSLEARLKGPEKFIKVRGPEMRLGSASLAHTPVLPEISTLTHCYKKLSSSSLELRDIVFEAEAGVSVSPFTWQNK